MSKAPQPPPTGTKKSSAELWAKLEQGMSIETGKRLFYQLTDAEGGTREKRKCFAVIDFEYPVGTRDESGISLAVSLSIYRPLHLGGFFQKSLVPFTGNREPGTCDSIKPEDTAS